MLISEKLDKSGNQYEHFFLNQEYLHRSISEGIHGNLLLAPKHQKPKLAPRKQKLGA